jgi:hypothetical protein
MVETGGISPAKDDWRTVCLSDKYWAEGLFWRKWSYQQIRYG